MTFSPATQTVLYKAGGWTVDGRPNRKSWLKVVRSPLVPETALQLSFADDIYPHSRDTYGNTLLHYAAQEGNVDFCRHLVNNGWHALERNDLGRSPIDFSGNLKTKEFLLNHTHQTDRDCSRANETPAEVSASGSDFSSLTCGSFHPVHKTFDHEAGDWNLPDEVLFFESRSQEKEEKGDPAHAIDKELEVTVQLESSLHQNDDPLRKKADPRRDRSSDYYSNVKLATPQKVCDTLDISEDQLWLLVEEGSIPSYCVFQIGGLIRFNLMEILERGFS